MWYKLKRILMWVNQARLPSAYQEVEYIQSSGTQYIDTWIKPTNNTKIVSKLYMTSWAYQILCWVGRAWYYQSMSIYIDGTKYNYIGRWRSSSSGNSTVSSSVIATGTTPHIFESSQSGGFYIDWTKIWTFTSYSFTESYNMYLFGWNNYWSARDLSSGAIYYFKIYESWTLVRDFIPCYRKSDSVIGLYDLVNNQFYTNSWTGTFTKWNDVNMVEKQVYPKVLHISSDLRWATLAWLQAQWWTDITSVSWYNLNSSWLSNTAVSNNNVLLYKYVPNLSSNNIITLRTTWYAQRNKSSDTYRYNSVIMIWLFNSTDASDNWVYASSLAWDYSACWSTQDTKTGINYRESNKALTILWTAWTWNQAGSVDMTTRINLNTWLVEYTLTSPQTHTTSATLNSTQLSLARSLKYIWVVAQPKDSSNTTTIYTVELTVE